MAIVCEGNTKISLTTLSFSINLSSDSFRYCMLWNFASFFQPHLLAVPVAFGPFYARVTKVFGWLLNDLINLSCGTALSLGCLIFFVHIFFFFFFFKSPVVSFTTKKLYKKERTCWGGDHFAVCYVVQWLHILYNYASVTWISDLLPFSSLSLTLLLTQLAFGKASNISIKIQYWGYFS